MNNIKNQEMGFDKTKEIINSREVIETERLTIIPYTLDKNIIDDLYEIYSSNTLTEFYMQPIRNREILLYKANKDFEHMYTHYKSIRYLIKLKKTNKIIGVRNFHLDISINIEKMEITVNSGPRFITEIVINESFQNEGYALEASKAIFKYFEKKEIYAIATFIDENNNISKHLMKKLGFNKITKNEYLTEANFTNYSFHAAKNKLTDEIFIKLLNPFAVIFNEKTVIKY